MTLLPVLSVLAWFFSVPKALKIIIIVHVKLHVYLVEFYDKKIRFGMVHLTHGY